MDRFLLNININRKLNKILFIYFRTTWKCVLIKSSTKTPNIINLMAPHEKRMKISIYFYHMWRKIRNKENSKSGSNQVRLFANISYGYIICIYIRTTTQYTHNLNMKWYTIRWYFYWYTVFLWTSSILFYRFYYAKGHETL